MEYRSLISEDMQFIVGAFHRLYGIELYKSDDKNSMIIAMNGIPIGSIILYDFPPNDTLISYLIKQIHQAIQLYNYFKYKEGDIIWA